MNRIRKYKYIFWLILFFLNTSVKAQKIKVTYSSAAYAGPFSGKVILYLSKDGKTPKDIGYGMPLLCCFSITVADIKPNTSVTFDDNAKYYPVKLSEIERGEYYVQAVWDRNTGGRSIGNSADNMYNDPVKINLTKKTKQTFSINCSQVIPTDVFKETEFVKELKASSVLLSTFYNKPSTIDAAVILPKEYYDVPARKFPVLYEISGYGGDYHEYSGTEKKSNPIDSVPFITVFLDGNCSTGHSTYANSDNNGPWGDALVKELIPMVEKNFRCNGARLLTGHSSGGWSSLWLQVNYPKTFAGCWSSSPDPVDFRNFQQVNIYEDKNMYYDKDSELRIDGAIASSIPWVYIRDDYRMENVLYRGEQYWSWNAVFGKKLKDGTPEAICNVNTGAIDSTVATHWKRYDISLIIRNNWEELKPDIDNKVRISVGNSDNFFLNQSVMVMGLEMEKLNSKFVFSTWPGDHFTVWTADYVKAGYHFLATKYAEWLSQHPDLK